MGKTLFRLVVPVVAIALLLPPALAAGGGSINPINPGEPERQKTPEEQAVDHYNAGLMQRNRAWKLEAKLETAPAEKRAKIEKKINSAYELAIREFTDAIRMHPTMFEAYSSLGYAYRKTGDFRTSLQAYDQSLALNPDYAEAIEYRAEAYLGLNRIDDAQKAYMVLFAKDRQRADELMAAMKKWIAERQEQPGEVDETTLAAFREWVAEREQIARETASAARHGSRGDW